jgi:hypothetical protein
MDQEKVSQFLSELTELSKKYNIYIMTDLSDQLYMPYLTDNTEVGEDGEYRITMEDQESYGHYGKYNCFRFGGPEQCYCCNAASSLTEVIIDGNGKYVCNSSSCMKRAGRDMVGYPL